MSDPREHNTSAARGYLPVSGGTGDRDTDDLLQAAIVGITGLSPEMVRPRWQENTPRPPDEEKLCWASFGVARIALMGAPEMRHVGENEGHDILVSQEELLILVSFYGQESTALACLFRDAIHVENNRAPLRAAGLNFVKAEPLTTAAFVYLEKWRHQAVLPCVFRRETRRIVPVLNLRRSVGRLRTDAATRASAPIGCEACSRNCNL
jgi:hypothetical protein